MHTEIAVIIGATGGVGAAVADAVEATGQYRTVLRLSRSSVPAIDLLEETSILSAARWASKHPGDVTLVLDATGALTLDGKMPEKTWRELDAEALAASFAINAIGPALLMKHFLPLLAKGRRAVFATLSARVGSIGDNHLGGWYGYRASKAALNQLVRTASIELARKRPEAICVALHPGTVRTPLTEGFAKTGLEIQEPDEAAERLVRVVELLDREDTGGYFDHRGKSIPW